MRVLYLYKDYYPILGGIENHVKLLAEGLSALGVQTQVLVTNTANRTVDESIGGVPVLKTARQVNVSSAPVSMPFFPAVRRLETGVEIAHLHMPYPPG
ncbi:MAG: glycosyltransferase, partial [Caldilineaceae bacterium]|nr:glycosyltransferase [Caldilineaceae bacterium]